MKLPSEGCTIEFTYAEGFLGHGEERPKVIIRHPMSFTGLSRAGLDITSSKGRRVIHAQLEVFLEAVSRRA